MKSFIKNNIKFIIVIVICLIGSSITTLATNYIFSSNEVSYDNTESGLHADSVQGAIDEVFQHATDYSDIKTKIGNTALTTTSQTLIGAVNELNDNSGVTAGTYGPSANVNGANGNTISVPQITVNAKGKVTSITNRTYTSVNTDTNTWRGIQNNLTSTSTTDCLAAKQGKVLNDNKLESSKVTFSGSIAKIGFDYNGSNTFVMNFYNSSGGFIGRILINSTALYFQNGSYGGIKTLTS